MISARWRFSYWRVFTLWWLLIGHYHDSISLPLSAASWAGESVETGMPDVVLLQYVAVATAAVASIGPPPLALAGPMAQLWRPLWPRPNAAGRCDPAVLQVDSNADSNGLHLTRRPGAAHWQPSQQRPLSYCPVTRAAFPASYWQYTST